MALSTDVEDLEQVGPEAAERLAELASLTFHEAYADLHAAVDLDSYCRTHYEPDSWRSVLSAADHRVTVVRDAEGDAAFLVVVDHGTSAAPEVRAAELKQVYLRRRCIGTGLGQRLLAHASAQASALGADHLWLVVAEVNASARRFYERAGFEEIAVGPVLTVGREHLASRILLRRHGPAVG